MNLIKIYGGQYVDDGLSPTVTVPQGNDGETYHEWYLAGTYIPHRIGAPARIYDDGTEHWIIEGSVQREDGPAVIQRSVARWLQNNFSHRRHAPAHLYADGREKWFIDGIEITDDVNAWIREYDINLNWQEWTDAEKVLFNLKF